MCALAYTNTLLTRVSKSKQPGSPAFAASPPVHIPSPPLASTQLAKHLPHQQPPPALTEAGCSNDSESDDKVVTQIAAPLQVSKVCCGEELDQDSSEEACNAKAKVPNLTITSVYTTNYDYSQPTREEGEPAKKKKIKPKIPDPVTPAPLLPSSGTINISSNDPPVAGSLRYPDAISSSNTVGTEDQI
ncbi:hypothetical protein FRC12_022882 [Ceratobasidium sp. 428]|nr:hypothetical protein FRC12_022882 [Ceratobasidium sp. 428]